MKKTAKNVQTLLLVFGIMQGYCYCNSELSGRFETYEDEVIFNVTLTKGDGSCKKTYVRQPLRNKFGKILENQTADEFRSKLSNQLMRVNDPEPPHLPRSEVLRTLKKEFKAAKYLHKDPVTAISLMHASSYTDTIHYLSEIPFCVHFWTNHQRAIYCRYAAKNKDTCVFIDSTGGIFSKFIKRNGTKTRSLFLYIIAVHFNGEQFTVGQMISEAQDTVTILNFWNNWLKYGFPQPSEVVMDSSEALLNATTMAFTGYKTIDEYSNALMKEVPKVYIRLDVAHFMKLYATDLKKFPSLVRIFYLACIGKLICFTDENEARQWIKAIFTVASCERTGLLSSGVESPCSLAKSFLKKGITVSWAAQVDVQPKELLVLPGNNATFLCRVGVPLQYCRAELPDRQSFNLNKQLGGSQELSYFGNGLEAGQCGVTIHRVEERHNGIIKCTLGIPSETTESVGVMKLIVAKAPKTPELDLSKGTDSLRAYKINDVLEASCIVKDGRPVANISWYLDDEQIPESALKMATVVEMVKEDLQSKLQNFSRTLQPSDNGRFLRCVAFHAAYPGGFAETKRQLDVKFAPLPIYETIDKFGYQIGKVGNINITIEANPKPKIEWTVGGQQIRETATDNTGRIEAEALKDLGRGRYEANLRLAGITKQDTEIEYRLTAYNDQGSQDYKIKISTNPEPEGVELGVGAIIGVVVVVLFVVLIASVLIFAKMTGRWCFSGGATVIDYTTGENGQPPHHDGSGDGVDNPHHQVSNEYVNGGDLPIKKDEKINTAV